MKKSPPMLSGSFILGHLGEFKKDRFGLFERGLREKGRVFGIRLSIQPVAVLIGPELHQIFFMETDKKLSMHKTYRFLGAMFGEVAFTAPPEVYARQRPILHSPFKREKMKKHLAVMQQEVQDWLDSLGEAGEMDINHELIQLIQHIAAHALMGEDFRRKTGKEFWGLFKELNLGLDPVLPPFLPLPKFRRRDKARAALRSLLQPLIEERRQNPELHDDFLQEFVDARYADGTPVEDETIISLILGLVFGGHETTLGQASWAVIQLLQNPEYKKLVQDELQDCLPRGTDISLEKMGDLKHLEWAIRETERMKPSTDLLMRYAEEDVDVGEYRIPAGWFVMVCPPVAQRLPEWFNEPDRYDPLRFSPGREEDKRHRFSLITFGGGVHKCAGMNFAYQEMTIITALLLQQFDLELLTTDPKVEVGMGASRPERTIISYRRKPEAIS
jgi:sterol 14alpha-demethylase